MKSKPAFLGRTPALLALACVAAWGLSAQAQPVYRVVGPDGKVTFSDKPPADAKPAATVGGTSRPTDNKPALPYELQQLAGKYPVTLYSTNGCGPCDSGRALLTKRGIPFVEKTVNTNEDLSRLRPHQQRKCDALADDRWAGGERLFRQRMVVLPRRSGLPQTVGTAERLTEPAAAEPLSPLKTAAQAPAPTDAGTTGSETRPPTPPRPRPAAPPATNPNNPAGIRF
jgi:hypothetical protein